ncbi:hypothetical protein PRIPAC_74699 [Pristionchus pacificus]|uniref:C2H2-type domain-containing protein n=1 Tax=Pristionchus pacificus TaxID=54126 RepID=A0A2A6C7Y4_PRIPA|nr:hypothetical protein PRIPAC_74699 [Pristionchus pacificus]|eukprot:PDM74269.1 hypothetical protein PRIPAC_41625 [Pristionchus pacificus]
MSSQETSQESATFFPDSQLSDMSQALQQAHPDEQSSVSLIILHMSELLSSFVREDTPEMRAKWATALAGVRDSVQSEHAHEELRFISDFSVMLEDGLQCLADKCAQLEQAVKDHPPREHDYVYGRSPSADGSLTPPLIAGIPMPSMIAGGPGRKKQGARLLPYPSPSSIVARHAAPHREPPAKYKQVQFVGCDLCKRAIPRLRMANHLRHVHPEEFEKHAKFRCEYCKTALFIKQGAYDAHLDSCHVRLELESLTLRMPYADELMCRMCGAQCATVQELADHAAKMHPAISIMSCTGCGALFRQPDALMDHWREAKKLYAHSKCAASAPAHLLPRPKLVSQILAHARATGKLDKDFTYIQCMAQEVACEDCGLVVSSFKLLYDHVHRKHSKIVQGEMSFGCIGCGSKYKCVPSLKEHLLRAEIEEYSGCCNAGVAYWSGEPISRDMRPKETIARERRMEKEEAAKEERDRAESVFVKQEMDVDGTLDDMPALSQHETLL